MYIINKPKELTKVTKLNAEEIFLAENTYYIKSVDIFYSVNKEMLKKISFGDRTGLCIKAYRELEDMQLLTMKGITTIKGFKVIEIEEYKRFMGELDDLIVRVDKHDKDMEEFVKMWGEDYEDDYKKRIKARDKFCPNCCGTCLDCPYIYNSNGEYDYNYFLRWG